MTNKPKLMQAALYLRSSKDRSDVSIDAQRRELARLAGERGYAVVEEYADVVESGKDDQRAGFQKLLKDLKARTRLWSAVIVYDTSRIARRRYISVNFDHDCQRLGVT